MSDDEIIDHLTGTDLAAQVEDDYDATETLEVATALVREGWNAEVCHRQRIVEAALGHDLRVVWVGGGGLNFLAQRLAPRIAVSVIVDPSMTQLRAVPDRVGTERQLHRAAAEALPIEDGWADLVDLQGVLDHVVDPALAVAEAIRVTRSGGMVTAALTNDGSWFRRAARRVGRTGFEMHDIHAHHFTADALHDLFVAAGLLEVQTSSVMFLRIPGRLGRLPSLVARPLAAAADALGSRVAPRRGGIIVAHGFVPPAS